MGREAALVRNMLGIYKVLGLPRTSTDYGELWDEIEIALMRMSWREDSSEDQSIHVILQLPGAMLRFVSLQLAPSLYVAWQVLEVLVSLGWKTGF